MLAEVEVAEGGGNSTERGGNGMHTGGEGEGQEMMEAWLVDCHLPEKRGPERAAAPAELRTREVAKSLTSSQECPARC